MTPINCYCGSTTIFSECCEPIIKGKKNAATPEVLMRSRYTAYVLHNDDYLVATTHESERKYHNKTDILDWAQNNTWLRLEVISIIENKVEFKAYFLDSNQQNQIHHEYSTFKSEGGTWYYLDGDFY